MTVTPARKREAHRRRHARVRKKVSGTPARPRLCVFRSNQHISAQIIDDRAGHTLAAASTTEPGLRPGPTGNIQDDDPGVLSSASITNSEFARIGVDRRIHDPTVRPVHEIPREFA